MPSLTPVSEGSESLTPLRAFGFIPGTTLHYAPYPYPGPTSYPGYEGQAVIAPSTLTEQSLNMSVLQES